MRVTALLFIMSFLTALFLWVTLSGALFFFGLLLLLLVLVVMLGYPDTAILFFLGAREVRRSDAKSFSEAAAQEAYKLALPTPRLYFYNGALERGFILQNKRVLSLVLSKELLENCSFDELSAICFELLLQVKKEMAMKRTKVMFLLGFMAWVTHAITGPLLALVPVKELKKSIDWILCYTLTPWLDFLFKMILGKKYFKKLNVLLDDFPPEKEALLKVGLKLRRPLQIYSLPSRKMLEFASLSKGRSYQNILALEFLPHEWDLILRGDKSAAKA